MGNFITHGYYQVSNTGGYEIMISDCNSMAKVKESFGHEDNIKVSNWLPIENIFDDDQEEYIDVIDPFGYSIPLNYVIKVTKK